MLASLLNPLNLIRFLTSIFATSSSLFDTKRTHQTLIWPLAAALSKFPLTRRRSACARQQRTLRSAGKRLKRSGRWRSWRKRPERTLKSAGMLEAAALPPPEILLLSKKLSCGLCMPLKLNPSTNVGSSNRDSGNLCVERDNICQHSC